MFYKIRELSSLHDIILHYFSYKSNRNARGLEGYCREIHSYERLPLYRSLPLTTPYIIGSRNNHLLAEKLMMDDYPVLLEGIHCAGFIPLLDRKKVVMRMHNDEAEYYKRLAKTENNIFKKIYHANEARLLKTAQYGLDNKIPLALVSHADMEILKTVYGKSNLHYIPSFTPWQKIDIKEGSGEYCLYHGNLEVAENRAVAEWMIRNIVDASGLRFIIAGKGGRGLPTHKKVTLISNPTDAELDELIKNAHVNVLPSFNNTGLKLKMLHALAMGRHCLTNSAGVEGTDLKTAVTIANSVEEFQKEIKRLMETPFTNAMNAGRAGMMEVYNNKINAAKLSALLY